MRFWDWALRAYARPGVAEACLELQDRHGQSVPYLLWALWAAEQGLMLAQADLTAGAALAARWDSLAVAPLRRIRRALKPAFEGVDDVMRMSLRQGVQAAELQAEQALMNGLEALVRPAPATAQPPLSALQSACAAWGRPVSQEVLNHLVRKLL
jgi:uncharacterized protein (TIGR02444 family)